MSGPSMPNAICFDLFETLITEYQPNFAPSTPLGDRLQLDSARFVQAWRDLIPARFRGEIADYPSLLRRICQQLGSPVDEELIAQLHTERTIEKARPFAKIAPPIITMLETLQAQDIKLALVSNASVEEVTAWENCALAPFFDATIFSFQVGWVKPEVEIYRVARAALQVEASQTLFVGDGGSDELMGAQKVGMTPLWATWFLDAWPIEKPRGNHAQFTRVATPNALLEFVERTRGTSLPG